MHSVKSSIIKSIGYEAGGLTGILFVQFSGGALYSYDDVPIGLYEELKAAKSPGAFFMANIKGKFPTSKKGESRP